MKIVIPAPAGIQHLTSQFGANANFGRWMPACAGMTPTLMSALTRRTMGISGWIVKLS
jgi:hypothetical protein